MTFKSLPPAELEAGDDGLFQQPVDHTAPPPIMAIISTTVTAMRLIELADYTKSLTYNKSITGFFYGYQLELIANSASKGLGNGSHMGLRPGPGQPQCRSHFQPLLLL